MTSSNFSIHPWASQIQNLFLATLQHKKVEKDTRSKSEVKFLMTIPRKNFWRSQELCNQLLSQRKQEVAINSVIILVICFCKLIKLPKANFAHYKISVCT